MKIIADAIVTGDNLRVIFDDAAIDDLLLAAEINGAVSVHSAAVEAGDPLAEMEAATVLLALLGRLTKPARAVILQNRDRSTPAMIAQMTQIASGPDYYRVAPTKEFASGTPIVFGNDNMLPPGVVIGRKDKAVAADGQRFPVRYAVVEASAILTSNKADGTAIPEYEGGAYGKLRAIAGNGRLAGLVESFNRGTAADYVRELAEDDSHGIAPDAIAQFERPVLVRVMQQEDVTENIGDISNQRGTSDLSPVEQAQNDSKRLDLSDMDIRDDGSPSESAALAFIAAMPESERNNLMDGKHPGQKAYDRLMATVFWKAYADPELVRLYAQSVDAEVKTILGGMASAAADLAKLAGAGELDIRGIISEAAGLAVNAKRQGVKLSLFAQQADMTLDPDTISVVRMFAENIRSAKKIGERLRAAARFAYEEFTKEDNDMFGAVEKASREQVLAHLDKPVEVPESSMFDAVGDLPASWLGFKLINQATVEEMGAALPSENAISGPVFVALNDADGDSLYVAGKVVGVAFTAAAVRYSVAFPIAPQPREGVTLYAVIDNIESELVLTALPDDEYVFDAVLTEDAAKLMPVPVLDSAIFDAIDPMLELELSGKLVSRTAALSDVGEDDPLAQLAIAGEIMGIIAQLTEADVPDEPEQADPLARARERLTEAPFKKLTNDFTGSLAVIKGVDEGTERGWDRALFVNSIVGKIKTQAKNDPELAGMLLAWLNAAQSKWKKPAITARNAVWSSVPDWGMYNPLFGGVAPAKKAPGPVVARAADYAKTGNYDVTAPDGKTYQIYRDTENGWWYQADTGRHFSEDVVGFNKEEAAIEVVKRGFQKKAIVAPVMAPEIPASVVEALDEPAQEAPKNGRKEFVDAMTYLKPFLSRSQFQAIKQAGAGEEAQYFYDKMVEMETLIRKMHKTYDQDGLGNKAIVTLHYFRGNSDWYITEKDMSGKGTEQAFGLAVLNGDRQNAELGYISIDELVARNAELDLHWEKKTMGLVKQAMNEQDDEQDDEPAAGPFDPFNPAWELPTAEIVAMSPDDYLATFAALQDQNMHAEAMALRAGRSGNGLWHAEALKLAQAQKLAGELTPALSAAQRQLAAKLEYAENPAAPLNAPISSEEMVQSAAEMGASAFAAGATSAPSQYAPFRNLVRNLTVGSDTWKAAYDAWSKAWHAANLAAPVEPADEPTPTQEVSMETLIKIAADNIAQLRRIDVYRVLNSAGNQREGLATYIIQNRPDLQREVLDVMAEEWPDLGYSAPAAPAQVEHAELLTPNADGTPKVLEVPPIPAVESTKQAPNPARAGDMAFLNGVISQNVDMWADDLADRIEGMVSTYENDAEVMELCNRAIESYADFMVAAA